MLREELKMRSLFSDIHALGISRKEKVKGSDKVLADGQGAIESQTCPHPGKWRLMLKALVWCSLVRGDQLSEAGVHMWTLSFS